MRHGSSIIFVTLSPPIPRHSSTGIFMEESGGWVSKPKHAIMVSKMQKGTFIDANGYQCARFRVLLYQ